MGVDLRFKVIFTVIKLRELFSGPFWQGLQG